ncbi:hypothetical protein [Streptomyces sp. Ag109_O5-1]
MLADRWATASSGAHDPERGRARRSVALLLDLRQQLTYHGCGRYPG